MKISKLATALYVTIRDAGPEGAPAGAMYIACMQHGVGIDEFQQALALLERMGCVTQKHHIYIAKEKTT